VITVALTNRRKLTAFWATLGSVALLAGGIGPAKGAAHTAA